MKTKFYAVIIACTVMLISCDQVDNTPGQYSDGVFVINEGSFGNSNGELSFINSTNSVSNNLYSSINGVTVLGDVFQSMTISNGKAYLVINNSNKIVVLNGNDLMHNDVITGFSQPRYMVTYNGKGYISEWFSFSGNGYVKVMDLGSNNIVDSVQVGIQPENMLVVGSNILVANSGDTTLHIINTNTMGITHIGDIDYPKYIAQTNDGNIWVLYTGKPAWSGTQTDGGLLVLNSTATAIVKTINIGSTATNNPSQLTTDGNYLYYEYLGNIYKIDKSATVAPPSPFIPAPATYLYGLGYDNNLLYVGDAKNFTTSGVTKRYDISSGALIDTFAVGVAPNGFIFN